MEKLDSLNTTIFWVAGSDCVICQQCDLPDPISELEKQSLTFFVAGAVHSSFLRMSFRERGDYLRSLFCLMVRRDNVDPGAAYNALADIDCFHYGMPDDFGWHDADKSNTFGAFQVQDIGKETEPNNVVAIEEWRAATSR